MLIAGPSGRGQSNNRAKVSKIPGPDGQALQFRSQTQGLSSWRCHLEEGNGH